MRPFFSFLLAVAATAQQPPVRGIQLAAPMPDEIPLAERFIKEALPKEGVNVLVLEINYRYQFAKHPEFDETPGKFPANQGTYCRSYCPLHPELHGVVFDLIDELLAATDADAFHELYRELRKQ